MALYKEIVTKAIVGKGKKIFKNTYEVEVENTPTTVLGCWVINHKFKGYKNNDNIGINGTFDINIWYSYDNDSKTTVVNKTIDYDEIINVKIKEESDISNDTDIIVRVLKQPKCSKVNIKDNNIITFDIEKELGVELVGEAKVKISVEGEEAWDEIDEDIDVDKEINNINENYI